MSIKKKVVYGVTGSIASGKTFLCNQLKAIAQEQDIPLHIIQVDDIRRYIMNESAEKKHVETREKLADADKNIFEIEASMGAFQSLINTEIKNIIQQQLEDMDGIVLLERAMLLPDQMENLVHSMIFVSCSPEAQKERLRDGDLGQEEIRRRIDYQNKQKIYPSEKNIQKRCRIAFDTTSNPPYEKYVELFRQLDIS